MMSDLAPVVDTMRGAAATGGAASDSSCTAAAASASVRCAVRSLQVSVASFAVSATATPLLSSKPWPDTGWPMTRPSAPS